MTITNEKHFLNLCDNSLS